VKGYKNFVFAPGQIGTSRPYGLWLGSGALTYWDVAGYDQIYSLDYAFVVLPASWNGGRYVGDTTGMWKILLNGGAGGTKFAEGYPCQGYFLSSSFCNNFNKDTSQAWVWFCKAAVGMYHAVNTGGHAGIPNLEFGYGCYTNGGMSGGPVFEYYNGEWTVSSVVSNVSNCVVFDGVRTSPDPNKCAQNGERYYSYNAWSPYFENVWVPFLLKQAQAGT